MYVPAKMCQSFSASGENDEKNIYNEVQQKGLTASLTFATRRSGQGILESNAQYGIHSNVLEDGLTLMTLAPIATSSQTKSAFVDIRNMGMYSTAHCLDNNDHQNEMATGNGRTATCNADHGLCTSKPIRDGNSTMEWNRMESNIQSCPSFACNSGLMMFAPIGDYTHSNSTIVTSASSASAPTYSVHGLHNNNQQNQMSTGNGQTTIYNASQSLCTTAKPIRPDSTTMWTNMQSHPIVAFNGGVMTFAPIVNSTASGPMYNAAHSIHNNNQQNQMSVGNGRTAIYNAGLGLCTTAKPIHDDSDRMKSNIQNSHSTASNSGLMMFAPIGDYTYSNSTIVTSASSASAPTYSVHGLHNNNQQNQISVGNGRTAMYNAGQSLCSTAKPIHDDSDGMESDIQNSHSMASNSGLMMFAPIVNSTTSGLMYNAAHGIHNNNQQNQMSIQDEPIQDNSDTMESNIQSHHRVTYDSSSNDNFVTNGAQDLQTEGHQSGLITFSSTEDSVQSKLEFTKIETWEDVSDLYTELMGTPLAVDGDIEVEICNAAQDICNDGQEYGSAIVAENIIGGDGSINLLTDNLDEDCYLGNDDDIIDIESIECSEDVGGDLDAILGSMSLVGYDKSANNSTCNVEGRQTDSATVPPFDPASAELDMEALKKNQSLSATIMSGKRSNDASKKQIQSSDIKGKTLPCPFCHKRVSQLARHMKGVHKKEPEIEALKSLTEEQTKEVRYRLNILKKRGQFIWNSNPENEDYIPSRRPKPGHEMDQDFFKYCPKCLGSFISTNIRHHYPKCFKGKLNGEHIALTLSKAIDGQIDAGASDRLRLKIFPVLRVDNIVKLIRYDSLLIIYGNKLCIKYTPHYQENMIRARLRLVGRLLFVLKNINKEISDLASVYNPKIYDSLIESFRVVGGYNPLTNEFKSPATASSAVMLVKQIGKILVAECIKSEDPLKQQRTENFLKLLESDVGTSILKCVTDTQARMRREKVIKMPTTEDVKRLNRYLKVERTKCFSNLKEKYSYFNWLRLAEFTMASIIIFNRRRTGETQNIVVKDFELREMLSAKSTPEFAALSEEDKKVASTYCRMQIRGKKGRKVPVLLTPDVTECLDLLVLYRATAGVPEFNKVLFGLPSFYDERIKVIDACMLMRKFSVLCGASDPESLRATEMRKHMASMCIAMNLNDTVVSQVADFMGHRDNIHNDIYRINPFDNQVVQMSKVLTTALGDDDDDDDDDDENCQRGDSATDSHLAVGINGDDDHYFEDNNSQGDANNDVPISSTTIFSNTGSVTKNQTLTNNKPRNTNKSSQKQQHIHSLSLDSMEENYEGTQSSLSKPKFQKRRWTKDEVKAVHGAFAFYFQTQTLPSTEEIKNQQTIHEHLRSRTWEQIKTWIHNQFKAGPKTKKRKFK